MGHDTSRRSFLKWSATGCALASAGDLTFLGKLPRVSAAEAQLDSKVVQLQPEIEPLVRLLEDTPRERLLEEVAARIHKGLAYREVLAALLLAGVRNVQPRPSAGHKFHAVLVVNSAHLASLASPAEHRWLPIFWALDYFKSSQAQDVREGNWTMGPVDEAAVPPAHKAREAFMTAMDNWDEAAADAAVASLARTAGANEVYELFFRYGCRDFRSIGHKAIYAANSYRTLNCIGWQHAEPVLRSLAYALLLHEEGNPAERDAAADQPGRRNQELAKKIRPDWLDGKIDDGATHELLTVLREAATDDACDRVVEMLNRGVAPQSVWDALFASGGELVARQPGIVSLHSLTSANALGFAYGTSGNDETRRLLLLQTAAFVTLFRDEMNNRGRVGDFRIDQLEPAEAAADKPVTLDTIFADVSRKPGDAAREVLRYLSEQADAKSLIDAARVLVFLKGNDAHDYKFSSAVLEDYRHLSPKWRGAYLAASVFQLPGSLQRDNGLVARTRAALNG